MFNYFYQQVNATLAAQKLISNSKTFVLCEDYCLKLIKKRFLLSANMLHNLVVSK